MKLFSKVGPLKSAFITLVVPDPNKPTSDVFALLKAASFFKEKTDILQLGKNGSVLSEFYTKNGINPFEGRILIAENGHFNEFDYEGSGEYLGNFLMTNKYSRVIMGNSSISKEILPRLAAMHKTQAATDVISIESPEIFKRPIYAGNAIAIIECKTGVQFIGIRVTSFSSGLGEWKSTENAVMVNLPSKEFLAEDFQAKLELVELKIQKSERPDLDKAKVVLSGGRGLKSAENFKMLYKLSDKFKNCAIGASRAAVDAGFCPNDLQVGQTGKIVAPELYIAFGISGAIQHIAGMKDSKVIVAVNNNEDAPIFQVASYGLVGDLFKVIPELEAKL